MKKAHKNILLLLLLFAGILATKIIASLLIKGPTIFSDETCVIQRALYFTQNISLKSCEEIVKIPDAGTPFPLYSILISPIYIFFKGINAYKAALILNAILTSTLVFPLYSIFKKFLKDNKKIFLYTTLTVFLSQIVIFEKTLMTESLFVVINIWLLHFYLNSFQKNKVRNKIISIILGILAAFTRPFGFMIPLAIAINEIAISKKRKILISTLLPISILATGALLFFLVPSIYTTAFEKIKSLGSSENWILILKALKAQIDSFTIATFLIPIPIFLFGINKKDSKYLKKIKYFLISLIALNLVISAQHIYGYYQENLELNLLTRYINISIIFIYIFSFIFLEKYKLPSKKKYLIIALILTTSLFFIGETGKFVQNMDILTFYKSGETGIEDTLIKWTKLVLIAIYTLLSTLLLTNKKNTLKTAFVIVLIITSIFSFVQLTGNYKRSEIVEFFANKENKKITYIIDSERNKLIDVWKLLALTENEIEYKVQTCDKCYIYKTMETDYIITEKTLELPIELESQKYKIYKQQN